MSSTKKWFAVYTKPRWEKKVHSLFGEKGIEAYCPLNRVRKQWSDRVKIVEEPLFKSYVFVKITDDEITRVRLVNGVVNYVYWLGKPAVIRNSDIERIRKFLNEYANIEAVALDIKPEMKVKINAGIFMDKEARVKKVLKKKVELIIESIGFRLVAFMDKSNVSVIEK